jgi:hypothetical protein
MGHHGIDPEYQELHRAWWRLTAAVCLCGAIALLLAVRGVFDVDRAGLLTGAFRNVNSATDAHTGGIWSRLPPMTLHEPFTLGNAIVLVALVACFLAWRRRDRVRRRQVEHEEAQRAVRRESLESRYRDS